MIRHEEARMEYGLFQTWEKRIETSGSLRMFHSRRFGLYYGKQYYLQSFFKAMGSGLDSFIFMCLRKHVQTSENSESQRMVPGYEPRQKGRGDLQRKKGLSCLY